MSKKILVVDDQPFMIRLVQFHLERAGFSLLSASNGRQAIEVAEREQPALIIMDVMMAEMDGLTALAHLKANDLTKNIPVIMITAKGHTLTKQDSETSGAAVIMSKPFSPTQLVSEVQRFISP